MTDDEDFENLHERALALMGSFAMLQVLLDSTVDVYLKSRMPTLGAVVIDVGLRRRRDEDRLRLIRALAEETTYSQRDVFTQTFATVFNRSKQMRDLVGHSVGLVGPAYAVGKPPHVGIARLAGTKIDKLPDPVLPSHFDRFGEQIKWLDSHVLRLGFEAGAGSYATFTGDPYEPPPPGPLPHSDL